MIRLKKNITNNICIGIGNWITDEVQWMFPALVGDREAIAPITPHGMYLLLSLHSSSFTAVHSHIWEGHGGLYGEGQSRTTRQVKFFTNPLPMRKKSGRSSTRGRLYALAPVAKLSSLFNTQQHQQLTLQSAAQQGNDNAHTCVILLRSFAAWMYN